MEVCLSEDLDVSLSEEDGGVELWRCVSSSVCSVVVGAGYSRT